MGSKSVKNIIATRNAYWDAIFSDRQQTLIRAPNNFWASFISLPNELIDIVFDHMLDHDLIIDVFKANNFEALRVASTNGHVDIVRFYHARVKPALFVDAFKALEFYALQYGHIDIVRFYHAHVEHALFLDAFKANNFYALRWASANGYLDIVRFYHAHHTTSTALFTEAFKAYDFGALRWASANGYLDIVRFYHEHVEPALFVDAFKAREFCALRWASEKGHVEIVRFYHAHRTTSTALFSHACSIHNITTLKDF